jgi:hypothetical protein
MASYTVNKQAIAHIRTLIEDRQYVLDSDWGESQPKADDENAYLAKHDWDAYAAWHLGLTDGATDETKGRYAFVVGDFRRVHRSGVIACHFRGRRVSPQGHRARRPRPAPAPGQESRDRVIRRLGF